MTNWVQTLVFENWTENAHIAVDKCIKQPLTHLPRNGALSADATLDGR
jgi:hypothetical protein